MGALMRKLETVCDLLDALKEQNGSDNRTAKELGIKQSTLSSWRVGRAMPREVHALLIAEALDVSPMLVMAIAVADKVRDKKVREAWAKLVKQLARAGLPALAAFLVSTAAYMPPAKASTAVSTYSVKSRKRRRPTRSTTGMLQAA
jgi:hypothetical protein